jgi:cation-transporting ATPase E
VLSRPLAGWKLALLATMVGIVAAVLVVPALGRTVVLLAPTPQAVLLAAPLGAAGALLVELVHRRPGASRAGPADPEHPGRTS